MCSNMPEKVERFTDAIVPKEIGLYLKNVRDLDNGNSYIGRWVYGSLTSKSRRQATDAFWRTIPWKFLDSLCEELIDVGN